MGKTRGVVKKMPVRIIHKDLNLGLTGRSAKKMARLCKVRNMEFSEFEKKFIEDHPQYQDKVSDFVQEVKRYTGFRINEEGVPMINVEWQDTEEPLAFVNIEVDESKQDFVNAGNEDQFTALLQYVDDHPEYLERLFNKEFEEAPVAVPKPISEEDSDSDSESDDTIPRPIGKSPRKIVKAPRKHPREFYHTKPQDEEQ